MRWAAVMAASSASGTTFGWPVWNHGPNAHGARAAGWRPVLAVKRRSACAGAGPENTRSRSARPSTAGPQRPSAEVKRLVSSLSTRTPQPRVESSHGTG